MLTVSHLFNTSSIWSKSTPSIFMFKRWLVWSRDACSLVALNNCNTQTSYICSWSIIAINTFGKLWLIFTYVHLYIMCTWIPCENSPFSRRTEYIVLLPRDYVPYAIITTALHHQTPSPQKHYYSITIYIPHELQIYCYNNAVFTIYHPHPDNNHNLYAHAPQCGVHTERKHSDMEYRYLHTLKH